jgi:hypothetical protein
VAIVTPVAGHSFCCHTSSEKTLVINGTAALYVCD